MSVVGLEHKVKAPTKKKKHISEEKKQLLAYGVDLADSDEDNDDAFSADSEDEDEPSRLSKNFEFTNQANTWRIVRLITTLQIIALLIDNRAIPLPILFHIICAGPLFYSLRFYSRPFIDFLYAIEYYYKKYIPFLHILLSGNYKIESFSGPNVDTSKYEDQASSSSDNMRNRRYLGNSNFAEVPTDTPSLGVDYEFINERNWHAIKYFSQFFLGIFFTIFAILFLLKMWDIQDYTNKEDIVNILHRYVANGWWRRGSLSVGIAVLKGCLCMGIFVLFVYVFAREANANAIPEPRMIGTYLALTIAITSIIWLIGYMLLRATEGAFVNFVSQNVGYTSRIIFKKVNKVKLELAMSLILLLYIPVLYNFTQTLVHVHDWSDSHAKSYRQNYNYYVPCYISAFPPYHVKNLSVDTCQEHSTYLPTYGLSYGVGSELYKDNQIVSCDSYLGTLIYTIGCICFGFMLLGYTYVIYRLLDTAASELLNSRWVSFVKVLRTIKATEENYFTSSFSIIERFNLYLENESIEQGRFVREFFKYIVNAIISLCADTINLVYGPITVFNKPVKFIVKRCCSALFSEEKKEEVPIIIVTVDSHGHKHEHHHQVHDHHDEFHVKTGAEVLYEAIVFVSNRYLPVNRIKFLIGSLTKCARTQVTQFTDYTIRSFVYVLNGCRTITIRKGQSIGSHHEEFHANWRRNLKPKAKNRSIQHLKHRITGEFNKAKIEFVTDHALSITVFDSVVDTSGFTFMLCAFNWNNVYFFMVIISEWIVVLVTMAISNNFIEWRSRFYYLIVITVIYGLITYIVRPYDVPLDRWLDFWGRLMIVLICVGILYSDQVKGQLVSGPTYMYEPWKELQFLISLNIVGGGVPLLVDVVMVLYMYGFIFYIISKAGVFRYFKKMYNALIYSLHDSVINFVVLKLDTRVLGFENIYNGMTLLQQWDDIIREQRRYALVTWPDVRPKDLVSTWDKVFTIKWASLFNLNIDNLRNSLGLTMLHIAANSADGEVTKWLIHWYPHLLSVGDAQRDTPVTIALKENAYYLLKYAGCNGGRLDDNTAYDDDSYASYYPEIGLLRDAAVSYGEYVKEAHSTKTVILTSNQLNQIKDRGTYTELVTDDKENSLPTFYNKILGSRAAEEGRKRLALIMKGGKIKEEPDIKTLKAKAKARREREAQEEKNSLYGRRFPEDNELNNFESGQMKGWEIIGLKVPSANIYYDKNDVTALHDINEDGDNDVIYAVPSLRSIMAINPEMAIPFTDPIIKTLKDWNIDRDPIPMLQKLGQKLFGRGMYERVIGEYNDDEDTYTDLERSNLMVRMKLCRFADILLSHEISSNCRHMHWDASDFKELNKLANEEHGRISQNLAMVCNMNPPPRFSRVSEWTLGVSITVFDEHPDEDTSIIQKAAVIALNNAHQVGEMVKSVVNNAYLRKRIKNLPGYIRYRSKHSDESDGQTPPFNDRVIHYLAECYVSSRNHVDLSDCELSVYGRIGWRAIARALRGDVCTFLIPSVYVGPKYIRISHLDLSRNELDDGDAVLLTEIIQYQLTLIYVNLNDNRIGARGFSRMLKILKGHENITTLLLRNNRIGPGCGVALADLLEQNKSLKVLDLGHNRMGELVRYPTLFAKEYTESIAKYLFFDGLKKNTSLISLDVSYNNLGPQLADLIPLSVNNHPHLKFLSIAGNGIGDKKGCQLIFALAGEVGGERVLVDKLELFNMIGKKAQQGVDITQEMDEKKANEAAERKELAKWRSNGPKSPLKSPTKKKGQIPGSPLKKILFNSPGSLISEDESSIVVPRVEQSIKAAELLELNLADNQLGMTSGHAIAAYILNNKSLTSLDVSNNALSYDGGVAVTESLEKIYSIPPRDFFKQILWRMEEKKYTGRHAVKRPKLYTHMTSLNMSRNHLGPTALSSIMLCLSNAHCTITNLNISHNPCGNTLPKAGDANISALDVRVGVGLCKTMTKLKLDHTELMPVHLVPILGSLHMNNTLQSLDLSNLPIDEPSCLQLSHGVSVCKMLDELRLRSCRMGPKGGAIVLNKLISCANRFRILDFSDNQLGPPSGILLSRLVSVSGCAIDTLNLSQNEIGPEGGKLFALYGLKNNQSLTDIDLSSNLLTESVAIILADAARGTFKDGKLISKCIVRRYYINDNPKIGKIGARELMISLVSGEFEHIEISNIGAGRSCAAIMAKAMRDIQLTWRYVDISGNDMGRYGLNEIFWALRQNRSIRVFHCGDNKAGPAFASNEYDNLLKHGIALARCLTSNVIIRDLDLSHNGIDSDGGSVIFNAMVDNFVLRRLILRGNRLDDDCSDALCEFIRLNNVLDYLDLGDNKLGYNCCFSIAEGMEANRSLKTLILDHNVLSNAGTATMEAFGRALMMNYSLKTVILDGNQLGPEWGICLAEAIARNNTLVHLSLKDNRFDSRAGLALYNSYRYAPYLLELALSASELGTQTWDKYMKVVMSKRAIRTLNELDDESHISESAHDHELLQEYD